MRFLCLIIIFFISSQALAQDDLSVDLSQPSAPMSKYDSVRSKYIKGFPDHFFLWPVIKQRKLDFELQNVNDRKNALAYRSNKPYSLGFGMYIFEIVFEIAFAVPLNERSKVIYGESDILDLQANIYGKRWGGEAYYQRYNGFYIDDLTKKVPANTPYPQRPDLETTNFGLTANYVFNSKKFSYRSAYNFADRQLRSAGTPVVFVSLNGFTTSGDTAIIGRGYQDRFGDDALIKNIRVNTLGVAPGYAYNFIFKGFFLNGTLALGPAHNSVSYTYDDDRTNRNSKIDLFVATRLSVGYNGDRVFGGLIFSSQARSSEFETVQLSSSNSSFKILVGYRIREFGFLKKRLRDLPKAMFN